MLKKMVVTTLAGAVLSTSLAALAEDDPAISYRQKVMGSNGANIGAIADILKFSLPYQDNIKVHANELSENASLIPSAFKKNVSEGPTDAKPEIWENWDEFEQYAKDLQNASDKLAEVAAGGDMAAVGAQLKEVGGACKQCHEDFRKPKEESYKNRM